MTRLSFEQVIIAGELSSLASCSQRVMRRFRGIHEAYAVLLGPNQESHDTAVAQEGAFQAIPLALKKLAEYSGAKTGLYAVLRSVDQLEPYLESFEAFHQTPRFRLSSTVNVRRLADKISTLRDVQLQAHLGGMLAEDLWSGPRERPTLALPPWGPGLVPWLSHIDPGHVRPSE